MSTESIIAMAIGLVIGGAIMHLYHVTKNAWISRKARKASRKLEANLNEVRRNADILRGAA